MFDFFKKPKKISKCPFYGIGCDHEYVVLDQMAEHLRLESYSHSKSLIEMLDSIRSNLEDIKKNDEINKNEITKLQYNEKLRDQMINSINQEIKSLRMENKAKTSNIWKKDLETKIDSVRLDFEAKNIERIKLEMEARQIENLKTISEIELLKNKIEHLNACFEVRVEAMKREIKDQDNSMKEKIKKDEEDLKARKAEHEKLTSNVDALRRSLENSLAGMNAEKIRLISKEIKTAMRNGKLLAQKITIFQQNINNIVDKITVEMNAKRQEIQQEMRITLDNKLSKINDEYDKHNKEISTKLTHAEKYLSQIIDGVLIWRINSSFYKLKTPKILFSKHFSSNSHPYKMRLAIRVHSSRFNVSLIVFHSVKDVPLPWPFKANVTIGIINPDNWEALKLIKKSCRISKPIMNSFNISDAFIFMFSEVGNGRLLERSSSLLLECSVNEM